MDSQTASNTLSLFEACVNVSPAQQPIIPRSMVDFQNLSNLDQLKLSEKFYNQPIIKEYTEAKWKAELFNRDSFLWLWDVLQLETDEIKKDVINKKLLEFKKAIDLWDSPYFSLLLDFCKYGFKQDEEVSTVAKIFNGEVQEEWDE